MADEMIHKLTSGVVFERFLAVLDRGATGVRDEVSAAQAEEIERRLNQSEYLLAKFGEWMGSRGISFCQAPKPEQLKTAHQEVHTSSDADHEWEHPEPSNE